MRAHTPPRRSAVPGRRPWSRAGTTGAGGPGSRPAARSSLRVAPVLLALAAAGAPAEGRTILAADLYGRANPQGISLDLEAARRWETPDGEGPLLRGRYLAAGCALSVNPAWTQIGPRVEWVPWAPLQLAAGYDLLGLYGANGTLLRLPSDGAPFGSSELSALRGQERSGWAHRAFVQPVVRARVGRLLLRSAQLVAWYRLAGRLGTYYESEFDTLLRERDLVFQSRTTATFELWRDGAEAELLLGPGYEYTRASRTGVERHRAGAVLFWVPADRRWGLDRPRLLAWTGLDLADRNRRGQPFLVLGLGADLDL